MERESDSTRGTRAWIILPYLLPLGILLFFRAALPANICDDAYITFRAARNLCMGEGLVFNPGDRVFGITTLLWAFLLGGMRCMNVDLVAASKWAAALLEATLLISLVRFAKTVQGKACCGLFSAIFLVTNPVFLLTSFSGMETALYLFLIVLAFHLLAVERFMGALAVASLGLWCRFDGALLAGVILACILIRLRGRILLRTLLPGAALLAGYLLFACLCYGDMVPMSFRRKLLTPVSLKGAWMLALQFLRAPLGYSGYWYTSPTHAWIALPLGGMGLVLLWKKKCKNVLPLAAFLVLYSLLFIGSARRYGINFPWYFVPPLLFTSLSCGTGAAFLVAVLERTLRLPPPSRILLPVLLGAGWTLLMAFPIFRNGDRIQREILAKRERVYGVLSVWLSRGLPKGEILAAHEIGAAGFFARPETEVFDLFGLIRKPGESGPLLSVLEKRMPGAIITRDFYYKNTLERAFRGGFRWWAFKGCWVGIRQDLSRTFFTRMGELETLYPTFDVNREFSWREGEAGR